MRSFVTLLVHQFVLEQKRLLVRLRSRFRLKSLSRVQQAPDYRLYKSEPELTTVKEEADEANNGEDRDKTENAADGKEAALSKGLPAAAFE